MAKINFRNLSIEAVNMLGSFETATILSMQERDDHRRINKEIDVRRQQVIADRVEAISQGMSEDEAIRNFSLVEVEKEQGREDLRHEKIMGGLRQVIKKSTAFVTKDFYKVYKAETIETDGTAFIEATASMLEQFGIQGATAERKDVVRFANDVCKQIGNRPSNFKQYKKDGYLLKKYSRSQFADVFTRAIIDTMKSYRYEFRPDVDGSYAIEKNQAQ